MAYERRLPIAIIEVMGQLMTRNTSTSMVSITWCTGARHVIHHIVYLCSPRHPPNSVLVLATSLTR